MEQTIGKKKRKKTKKEKPDLHRDKKQEHQDLCTTCNTGDECIRTRGESRPIHFCEEFDDYTPPVPQGPRHSEIKVGDPISDEKYSGLCVNCDERKTCSSSSTEGGIWHCENYS